MKNLKNLAKRTAVFSVILCAFVITCGFTSPSQKIYDDADLLSEEEEQELENLCLEYIEKTESDIVIHTTDTLDGKEIFEYADDYFDYNGFGYDEEMGDGLVFVIDMADRELAISTSGKLVDMLSKSQTEDMISDIAPYLTEGEYYQGCEEFLDSFLKEYNYSIVESYKEDKNEKLLATILEIVVALIIGGIVTGIAYSGHNTKMTVNGYTYAKEHKCEVRRRSDIYTNTTKTVRVIENNSSSGSRVGSSGNTHGGSSGKF